MTDQKKPETIADDDLEDAQGGFIAYGNETSTVKAKPKKGDSFITYGQEGTTLKKPGLNMEVVNEDE